MTQDEAQVDDKRPSRKATLSISVGAFILAAIPHAFLRDPLTLHADGQTTAWLGLTVWSPAFLAAVALFAGAELDGRVRDPLVSSLDGRIAAGVAAPFAVLIGLIAMSRQGSSWLTGTIEWVDLGSVALTYAAVYATSSLFWQGLFQDRALDELPRLGRLFLITLAGAAVWVPFGIQAGWSDFFLQFVAEQALIYFGLALLFEIGLATWICMCAGAAMGLAWAWTHFWWFA